MRGYDKRPVEHTVSIRRSVQIAFLLLNLWIGVQFYIWVRFFETNGESLSRHPVGADPELLVPVSVSVWRVDGAGVLCGI